MSLNEDIQELNELFQKHGVKKWRLNRVSSSGSAKAILSNFGGMGSINDVYVCRANGHRIKETEEEKVNTRVRNLLSQIYHACSNY